MDDPEKRAAILDLYARLRPKGRVSFNAVLHRTNFDRHAIQQFFIDLTGDAQVPIGEGSLIDPYDEGGMATSLQSEADHLAVRRETLTQIPGYAAMNFQVVPKRMAEWIDSFAHGRDATSLGQKCGMDRADNIAVNLRGNVLTCQNVSVVSVSLRARRTGLATHRIRRRSSSTPPPTGRCAGPGPAGYSGHAIPSCVAMKCPMCFAHTDGYRTQTM